MKKRLLMVGILTSILAVNLYAQLPPPKRELRGAWIATYANIDWPNKTQTPQQQRDALIGILTQHQQTGINTIYLQVRSQSDAMYQSAIDPWSADLTGTQGTPPNPLWDPINFAIEECHKRGMELHTWINPYRAVGNSANLPGFHSSHVAKAHPDWTLTVGTGIILNPGMPEVRDYITSVITDILTRYDVDGIHFDDYFYPSGTISDDNAYNADPRGFAVRADWRRDNINLLIKRIYDSVLSIKPWVKFGISPSGIYRNSTDPNIGSNTSGLEHYTTYYADTKKWLQQGWVDYIMPQVYWYIGQPGANYSVLIPWWNNQASGRHIYIGLAGYKVGEAAQAAQWQLNTQIPDQLKMNRSTSLYPNIYGQSVYNTTSLKNNKLNFRDSLRINYYQKPALLPVMTWRDNVPPAPATTLTATRYNNDSTVLKWTNPAIATNELDKVKRVVIYRSESQPVDITDANNIVAITPNDTTAFSDENMAANITYYYVVTTIDRFHNESTVSNTAISTTTPVPLQLLEFYVKRQNNQQAIINWKTTNEQNIQQVDLQRGETPGNFKTIASFAGRNSLQEEQYAFTDNIAGTRSQLFYQLRMVDKDGKLNYSPIKSLSALKDNFLVNIYPTIVHPGSVLHVETNVSLSNLRYNIFNSAGVIVQAGTITGKTLSINALSAGNYFIQFAGNNQIETLPFIIQ